MIFPPLGHLLGFSDTAFGLWAGTAVNVLIIMALTAVGLSADFKKMLKTGLKPLFLGLIVWFTVTVVSIGVQFITGQI